MVHILVLLVMLSLSTYLSFFRKYETLPLPPPRQLMLLGNSQSLTEGRTSPSYRNGVVCFGYNQDLSKSLKYVHDCSLMIKSLDKNKERKHEFRKGLFTNANITDSLLSQLGFDDLILIPNHLVFPGRQWLTRLLLLNHSVYERTLAIDSDRVVCSDISEVFAYLENYDLLGVFYHIPSFDNGVLAYKRSERFDVLINYWYQYQVAWNKYGDDQATLSRAIESARRSCNIQVGVLPSVWQVKFVPTHNTTQHSLEGTWRTRVLHDKNVICSGKHCFDNKYDSNRSNTSPKMYFKFGAYSSKSNRTVFTYKTFYSMEECMQFTNIPDSCLLPKDFSWDDNKYVVHRDFYISKWCESERSNLHVNKAAYFKNNYTQNKVDNSWVGKRSVHRDKYISKLCLSSWKKLENANLKAAAK